MRVAAQEAAEPCQAPALFQSAIRAVGQMLSRTVGQGTADSTAAATAPATATAGRPSARASYALARHGPASSSLKPP